MRCAARRYPPPHRTAPRALARAPQAPRPRQLPRLRTQAVAPEPSRSARSSVTGTVVVATAMVVTRGVVLATAIAHVTGRIVGTLALVGRVVSAFAATHVAWRIVGAIALERRVVLAASLAKVRAHVVRAVALVHETAI